MDRVAWQATVHGCFNFPVSLVRKPEIFPQALISPYTSQPQAKSFLPRLTAPLLHFLTRLSALKGQWFQAIPLVAQWKRICLPTRRHRSCGFEPWVRKIPWRRKWQHTPVFLSGKSNGQRRLVGYGPWGLKESGTTECTQVLQLYFFVRSHMVRSPSILPEAQVP